MSYPGEKECYQCHDVQYRATMADANSLFLAVIRTREYQEHDQVDTLFRFTRLDGHSTEAERLAARYTETQTKLRFKVHEIIVQMGLEE